MTILVTGGAGFIGSNFVNDWLATHDEPVVNLDALTYAGNLHNLDGLRGDARHVFVQGDIADRALLDRLLAEAESEGWVNEAADPFIPSPPTDPDLLAVADIVTEIGRTDTRSEVQTLLREMAGQAAEPLADGHANCFIETGFGKAILVDFNYDIQPVPGKFPLPLVGPMTLMGQTRLNHLGKLAFKPIYWHMLLPGRTIPLVASQMSTRGKKMEVLAAHAHA